MLYLVSEYAPNGEIFGKILYIMYMYLFLRQKVSYQFW